MPSWYVDVERCQPRLCASVGMQLSIFPMGGEGICGHQAAGLLQVKLQALLAAASPASALSVFGAALSDQRWQHLHKIPVRTRRGRIETCRDGLRRLKRNELSVLVGAGCVRKPSVCEYFVC